MTELTLKERQDLWLEALESGKYEQIRLRLRSHKGFCCLGVACDVYRNLTGNGEWERNKFNNSLFKLNEEEHTAELPEEVQNFFGFHNQEGKARSEVQGEKNIEFPSCMGMNDRFNRSFKQIAHKVRENREYYFG